MDRQSLLKKAAAVAGAVYFAPVLTSAASAGTDRSLCGKKKCKTAAKQAKCRAKHGGGQCDCTIGSGEENRCHPAGGGGCDSACGCDPNTCCNVLIPCNGCNGNGACFCNAKNPSTCTCIDLRDGFCSSFQPCNGTDCPAGQCCFNSCCGTPLCSDLCQGSGTGAASVRKGGPGMLFR
jgi:hypothetical protein